MLRLAGTETKGRLVVRTLQAIQELGRKSPDHEVDLPTVAAMIEAAIPPSGPDHVRAYLILAAFVSSALAGFVIDPGSLD